MTITILSTTLFISVLVNVVLIWYSIRLSTKYLSLVENLDDLIKVIETFDAHLKTIYEMETFYGDENLKHLLDHASSLRDILTDFKIPEDILETLEDITIEETNEQEKENQIEKDVFYAGSRRRDS